MKCIPYLDLHTEECIKQEYCCPECASVTGKVWPQDYKGEAMRTTYMTRADEGIGEGAFDSIKWIFETHIKEPDTKEFNFAVLHGYSEDSPEKIELWRSEPNYDTTSADRIWIAAEVKSNGEVL